MTQKMEAFLDSLYDLWEEQTGRNIPRMKGEVHLRNCAVETEPHFAFVNGRGVLFPNPVREVEVTFTLLPTKKRNQQWTHESTAEEIKDPKELPGQRRLLNP